jgi:hypothetical protein
MRWNFKNFHGRGSPINQLDQSDHIGIECSQQCQYRPFEAKG